MVGTPMKIDKQVLRFGLSGFIILDIGDALIDNIRFAFCDCWCLTTLEGNWCCLVITFGKGRRSLRLASQRRVRARPCKEAMALARDLRACCLATSTPLVWPGVPAYTLPVLRTGLSRISSSWLYRPRWATEPTNISDTVQIFPCFQSS